MREIKIESEMPFHNNQIGKDQSLRTLTAGKDMEKEKLFVNILSISHKRKNVYILTPSNLTVGHMTWRNSGVLPQEI